MAKSDKAGIVTPFKINVTIQMTDLVFHKAEKYIEEDLEYYFSGERDIHSQVKPGQDIYSFTPNSTHLNVDLNDGKIGNLFFPFAQGSLDRIYIGISFPLFANSWGAAFLSHLMTLVKPGGCVVLPVYPEMQASEKNYWSRSILENIFISRSRWKGMSNIWAENDGVMSMRIGRKPAPQIASNARYIFTQGSKSAFRQMMSTETSTNLAEQFLSLHLTHWESANISAILERIIQDHFGRKAVASLAILGRQASNPLIAIECLLSPYINISLAVSETATGQTADNNWQDVADMHNSQIENSLSVESTGASALMQIDSVNTIFINTLATVNQFDKPADALAKAWGKLSPNGLLIVYDGDQSLAPEQLHSLLSNFGSIQHYSAIAASEHKTDVEISHYSLLIEEELRAENKDKKGLFWVVQKKV